MPLSEYWLPLLLTAFGNNYSRPIRGLQHDDLLLGDWGHLSLGVDGSRVAATSGWNTDVSEVGMFTAPTVVGIARGFRRRPFLTTCLQIRGRLFTGFEE